MAGLIYAGDGGIFKQCPDCKSVRSFSEFGRDRNRADGIHPYCLSCVRERSKRFRKDNPDKQTEYFSRPGARERQRQRSAKWAVDNVDRVRRAQREYMRRQRATPQGKIESTIRREVARRLKSGKGGKSTFDLLGYTAEELMAHLERQFQSGMTWDNFGRGGWHIDHKVPLAAHNYERPDHIDFKRAWALSNLQPLWEPDNIRKRDRLSEPFQPSLAI